MLSLAGVITAILFFVRGNCQSIKKIQFFLFLSMPYRSLGADVSTRVGKITLPFNLLSWHRSALECSSLVRADNKHSNFRHACNRSIFTARLSITGGVVARRQKSWRPRICTQLNAFQWSDATVPHYSSLILWPIESEKSMTKQSLLSRRRQHSRKTERKKVDIEPYIMFCVPFYGLFVAGAFFATRRG